MPPFFENQPCEEKKVLRLNRKIKKYRRGEVLASYTFMAPWIIGLVVFTAYPFINSLWLSFTDSNVARETFIGLKNFVEMFTTDSRFIKSLGNTTLYALLSVPFKLICALGIALLLQNGMTLYRTVYYIPSIIGSSVAVAVMWKEMFGYRGIINSILSIFGVAPREWVAAPGYAIYVIILLAGWQFGSSMVIFISGLKNIPRDLYEAANIDGAGKIRSFFSITLPMLSSVIQFNLILQTIGAFQVFTRGFIITKGGPMDETLFTVHYIYEKGFRYMRLGYASAMSWVLLILIAVVSVAIFMSSKYWVFYENEKSS